MLLTFGVSMVALGAGIAAAKTFVYVSNAEDGEIDGYSMDKTGVLAPLGKTKAGKLVMPMAVSPDQKHLYAVVRSQPLRVITYAIDGVTGALKEEATAPLVDSMPYVSVDKNGRFLFTASYGGHKVAVNPIDATGVITQPASQVIPTGENPHSIIADRTNKYVYATNLGSAQILQFKFDEKSGKLTPNEPPLVKARPGNGPRHLASSNDNRYLYVLNELSGAVAQFAINQKTGVLSEVEYVGSVPPQTDLQPGLAREAVSTAATTASTTVAGSDAMPRIWAADIHITPDGRFMYTTERTNSTISLLSIAPYTGKLTYLASYATEKQPRGVRIDRTGSYLIAAGEKSDKLSVYKIDKQTGALTLGGRYPVGHAANWVVVVDRP
jgi:6-phosphogluconolactonase